MRLLLSSEAIPAGTPADLVRACRRRAFAGLEVNASEVRGAAALYGLDVPIPWLRLGEGTVSSEAVEAAQRHGAGLLLPVPVDPLPAGLSCAVVHGSDPAEVARAVAWAEATGAGTAWQAEPEALTAERRAAVLARTQPTLAHVRLLGAGPEAEEAGDGEATASLMVRLVLGGYTGTVTLAPSARADLSDWARWLFASRSWGCGSAHERRARVPTTPTA